MARKKAIYSLAARRFIARKVRKNIMEGRAPKQAVAIALSQARKRGFKIPRRR